MKLCGKKKIEHYFIKSFLRKRSPLTDHTNVSKRQCIETSAATGKEPSLTEMESPVGQSVYSTILWDFWRTGDLHEKGIDGRGVGIAFLDSGISIAHTAFTGRIAAVHDVTCSENIDLTTDRSGHGTLCASIACGAAFKSIGSKGQSVQIPAGVAPGANIVMYKIAGSAGQAHIDMITKGLKQCLEDKERYNIDIVLLPYGSDNYDCDMCDAIDALIRQGVLVVTASGNNGKLKEISYPARFGHTICVGAHDKHGRTTLNTSEGRALDFTAPGENLAGALSVHPSMFTTGGGTSVAAACVAGLLALIIQHTRNTAKIRSNAKQLSGIKPSVNELVHHQHTVKKVLQAISRHSSKHNEYEGYGCLDPSIILSNNHKLIELLYKDYVYTNSN